MRYVFWSLGGHIIMAYILSFKQVVFPPCFLFGWVAVGFFSLLWGRTRKFPPVPTSNEHITCHLWRPKLFAWRTCISALAFNLPQLSTPFLLPVPLSSAALFTLEYPCREFSTSQRVKAGHLILILSILLICWSPSWLVRGTMLWRADLYLAVHWRPWFLWSHPRDLLQCQKKVEWGCKDDSSS